MDLGSIPLFSMLRGRLGYLSERQRVVAENVSNSDTPGYSPNDLKPFAFSVSGSGAANGAAVAQSVTQPGHMVAPNAKRPGIKTFRTHDSETTLDGNSVVLEEEMMKMTDARMDYDAAISFYQKSLNMLRLAAKAPGR
ncbi:flagellar basal body rod protein FlgB [Phenylobacterium sp.]|jgi:flagellar basal-body rod protein FlgB|uniref:flagellar basal body rod protein FlgB n=1 Tax=Phenylobacterium sp. TaxID=1871053 RepID=UPI0039C98D48